MSAIQRVKIEERVRVLAAFAGGEVRPVRFKWDNRTYTVERINGQWRERGDEDEVRHFSVQVESGTYFLHVSSRDLQWWLDELIME